MKSDPADSSGSNRGGGIAATMFGLGEGVYFKVLPNYPSAPWWGLGVGVVEQLLWFIYKEYEDLEKKVAAGASG